MLRCQKKIKLDELTNSIESGCEAQSVAGLTQEPEVPRFDTQPGCLLSFLLPQIQEGQFSTNVGWLVVFGFNGPLRQYFSLYRAVSQKEGERGEKG